MTPASMTPPDTFANQVGDLKAHYAGTGAAVLSRETIYAIPKPVVDRLHRAEFLTTSQQAAEHRFTAFCERQPCVGIRGEWPIWFWLLQDESTPPTTAGLPAGFALHRAILADVTSKLESNRERLRGVVGRLLTEPTFWDETNQLRLAFEELDPTERPSFPLGRPLPPSLPETEDHIVSERLHTFVVRLRDYLDRWGLIALVDWDLPDPQGPRYADRLPAGALAEPTHGIRLSIPLFYPVVGDDDLLRQVRLAQRQAVAALGLTNDLAGISHHEQYAQMFRLVHLKRTVWSRYPTPPPCGLVGAFEAAAATWLDLSAPSVKRLHGWINACLAGKRPAKLKPRS